MVSGSCSQEGTGSYKGLTKEFPNLKCQGEKDQRVHREQESRSWLRGQLCHSCTMSPSSWGSKLLKPKEQVTGYIFLL